MKVNLDAAHVAHKAKYEELPGAGVIIYKCANGHKERAPYCLPDSTLSKLRERIHCPVCFDEAVPAAVVSGGR